MTDPLSTVEQLEHALQVADADGAQVYAMLKLLAGAVLRNDPDAATCARMVMGDTSTVRIEQMLNTEDGGVRIDAARGWPARLMCEQFGALLNTRAPNYVELRLSDGDSAWIVTVRRREGKTPAELVTEARAELAELKSRYDGIVKVIRDRAKNLRDEGKEDSSLWQINNASAWEIDVLADGIERDT